MAEQAPRCAWPTRRHREVRDRAAQEANEIRNQAMEDTKAIRGDAACVTLLEMNGFGLGYEGHFPLSVMQAAMKWRDHADEFADTLKIASIFSKYTLDRYGGHYYGKAQNLRRRLRNSHVRLFRLHAHVRSVRLYRDRRRRLLDDHIRTASRRVSRFSVRRWSGI